MSLNDAINPVLMKEVRQSLRGRYFKSSFLATLVLALLVALMTIATSAPTALPLGESLFTNIFVYLLAATQILVPLAAFLSLGQEWEENTLDLLLLADLRPRAIVLGKLMAAGIHVLIYYSAFTPFVVLAFLLRGLDLMNILTLLALSALASLVSTLVALALSSLARTRPSRVVLIALVAVASVYVVFRSPAWVFALLRSSGLFRTSGLAVQTLFWSSMAAAVAAFAFAVTCGRLAHAQENRSTGLRILIAATGACLTGWMAYLYRSLRDPDTLVQSAIFTIWLITLPCLFLATEAEAMPALVRRRVPRQAGLAALATPFLPGGSRGFLFWLLMQGLPLAIRIGLQGRWPPHPAPRSGGELALYANLMYAGVIIGLPSVLAQSRTGTLAGRVRARCACGALLAALIAGPMLAGLLLADRELARGHHLGNPLWFSARAWSGAQLSWQWCLGLSFACAATLLLNVRRLARGIAEVWRASAERRAYRQSHPLVKNA